MYREVARNFEIAICFSIPSTSRFFQGSMKISSIYDKNQRTRFKSSQKSVDWLSKDTKKKQENKKIKNNKKKYPWLWKWHSPISKGSLSKYIVRFRSPFDFHGKKSPGKNSFDAISLRIPSLFHSPRGKQFSLCPDLINLYNRRGGKKKRRKEKKERKKLGPRDQPRRIRSRAKNEYKLVLFRAQLIIPTAYVRI